MADKEQLKEELEDLVLGALEEGPIADSKTFLAKANRHGQEVVLASVLQSLSGFELIQTEEHKHEGWELTPEAVEYVSNGCPEVQLFNLLADGPKSVPEIEAAFGGDKGIVKVAQQQAMRQKWISIDRHTKLIARQVDSVVDSVQPVLTALLHGQKLPEQEIAALKKRKFLMLAKWKTFAISKGPKYVRRRKKLPVDLDLEMVQNGTWTETEFKKMNFAAMGPVISRGALHPLMKFRTEVRNILLAMGFEEMQTNNYVESCFWNFDALFQPQQHPARDSHDTFFLSSPASASRLPPSSYVQTVKQTHETGGWGSIGYRCPWKQDEAKKNILRTHTTAVSSRMLYKLGQEFQATGCFVPKKYFSIDRVFRNETLDATHLAEFHQVEGLVADRNLTLGDLIGVIKTFFAKIGISDVRFKPAYNPYTEPSMEIFGFSKQLNKWMEVGNSGVFRPEMLRPMGLPEDVNVIAWGLGLERPTMIKYGYKNIRDLFGHKVKLDIIEKNAVCRFY
eukprot:gb/GEZN01006230.1/.p1 GENE.gb/GEZN01006230.1/~~gb/GEZN01006230.1/.p1  ORF type:complete len:507 (+),score=97.02 gb/GEZN01006230.1/:36-1556(+)